jgi:hypothetical protein
MVSHVCVAAASSYVHPLAKLLHLLFLQVVTLKVSLYLGMIDRTFLGRLHCSGIGIRILIFVFGLNHWPM